ncbi:MAG: c-type cytochrome [Acidobacteria bacterium]|nr:c-type cytochrome [Acidobacteriota bacterium]MBI3471837.1 c-type cytochrome [Candidatus Solibacter usitatus]
MLKPLLLLLPLSLLAADPAKIARGKYLVEEVGRCQECHTPKLPDGTFDQSKWLKGAVLNVQPIEPIKGWHKTSPDLTRPGKLWTKWGEGAILKYMETGLGPNGKPADAPMPTYKLKSEDAEAVVEYLKSLQ